MSHESAIAGLKKLINRSILTISSDEHIPYIRGESDRAMIILVGSMIETFVLEKLKEKMPSLNSDEQARIFSFEGPCGSFSNRLRMAQALDIIDRPTRRKLELVKELRNAAAHANCEISFDTPEVREVVSSMFPADGRDLLDKLPKAVIRRLYERICGDAVYVIASDDLTYLNSTETLRKQLQSISKQLASHGKSRAASPRSRPAKGKTDKRRRSPPKASSE